MSWKNLGIIAVSLLMLGVGFATLSGDVFWSPADDAQEVVDEENTLFKQTTLNHGVFVEIATSKNCGPCYGTMDPAIQANYNTDFNVSGDNQAIVVTYLTDSYGAPYNHPSNNAPYNRVSHIHPGGGVPDLRFDDDFNQVGGMSSYASQINSASSSAPPQTAEIYIIKTDKGSGLADITVKAVQTSSSTPVQATIVAMIAEDECSDYYNNGAPGFHCVRAQLGSNGVNSGWYATPTLSQNTWWEQTWSNINLASYSISSFGNLYGAAAVSDYSASSGTGNTRVWDSSDTSNPAPGPDVRVTTDDIVFSKSMPDAGDIIDIDVTTRNAGQDVANSGSIFTLYRGVPANNDVIHTTTLNQLNPGQTQVVTASNVDTATITDGMKIYAEVTNVANEIIQSNNVAYKTMNFDLPPVGENIIVNDNTVNRGDTITLRANAMDVGDGEGGLTAHWESSPAGANTWSDMQFQGSSFNAVTGNWEINYAPSTMDATGLYDVRVQFEDSDNDMSPWVTVNNAVTVENNLPVLSSAFFDVEKDVLFQLDLNPYISDVETPNTALTVTSSSGLITINGKNIEGTISALGSHQIDLSINDGEDITSGNAYINVVNPGVPTWSSLPGITVIEDLGPSTTQWDLGGYVSDTNTAIQDLTITGDWDDQVNFAMSINTDRTITAESLTPDFVGSTIVTFTATDGTTPTTTQTTISVLPMNDNPLFTTEPATIEVNEDIASDPYNLAPHIFDADDQYSAQEFTVEVSAPSSLSPLDYTVTKDGLNLTYMVEKPGTFDFSLLLRDGNGGTATSSQTVQVFGSNIDLENPALDAPTYSPGEVYEADTITFNTVITSFSSIDFVYNMYSYCDPSVCYEFDADGDLWYQNYSYAGGQWTTTLGTGQSVAGVDDRPLGTIMDYMEETYDADFTSQDGTECYMSLKFLTHAVDTGDDQIVGTEDDKVYSMDQEWDIHVYRYECAGVDVVDDPEDPVDPQDDDNNDDSSSGNFLSTTAGKAVLGVFGVIIVLLVVLALVVFVAMGKKKGGQAFTDLDEADWNTDMGQQHTEWHESGEENWNSWEGY